MYNLEPIQILAAILIIAMIIAFFIMASKLSKITNILEVYSEVEFKKPEYQKMVKCEKCGKEFSITVIQKGSVNCPECKSITRI
jgi:predicted Zn-ribbon and HTH transcriptional regulator